MTCLAGQKLGFEMHVLANRDSEPAALVADKVWLGDLQDESMVKKFAKAVSAFAYDTEHLPISAVRAAAELSQACPHPDLLYATQNRIRERELLQSLSVPMPKVAFIRSAEDVVLASGFGFPSVLKTAEQGYDGKGQVKVERAQDLLSSWEQLGRCLVYLKSGFLLLKRCR
jgi:5-(carboxyamino)imidazole ribonucleotide synthase